MAIRRIFTLAVIVALLYTSCQSPSKDAAPGTAEATVKPVIITEKVKYDSDDPAIWINPADPSQSLVLGTDKEQDGALYVFDLHGRVIENKVIRGLKRPNNVDVEYGLVLGGKPTDIAVVTERLSHKLRIYSLPDMKEIDNGGIDAFAGDTGEGYRDLMGIGLYRDSAGNIYAIVGRKTGPLTGQYLWQYLLEDDGHGAVKATPVRKFGNFSGRKEIEAIAVDDKTGYVYYSDEGFGIRKYYADPSRGNEELAAFGKTGFTQDQEGISILETTDSTGYILVSDQQANRFRVFSREGSKTNPHDHFFIKSLPLSTIESDGSDIVSRPLGKDFPKGIFIAMSTDRTFQYYRLEDLMK